MVVRFLSALIFLLVPILVSGQSIDLSVTAETNDHSTSTFLLNDGKIGISPSGVQFLSTNQPITDYEAWGISPDYSTVSFLERQSGEGHVTVFNSHGDTLSSYSAKSLSSDDPSLAIYPFNNGDVLLQDNITQFAFFNTFGEIYNSMSSSSQSEQGEAISEVAMSSGSETLVIYNPKIKRSGSLGSKAQVMKADGSFENIYFSNDRYIRSVNISDDGNLVSVITAADGEQDRAIIMDKFGNEINRINTEEQLSGAAFSDDLEFITLYSEGRVMVFSTLDGESIGATSVSATVFTADYFAEEDLILMVTGNYSDRQNRLGNVEFRAIDIAQREIASQEFSGSLGFIDAMSPHFVRLSSNRFQLIGGSQRINIDTDF